MRGGVRTGDALAQHRIGARGVDMGDIGTERREVEFEPLPVEPVTQPTPQPEPTAPSPDPART
jgi:hypothetical protein